MSPFTLPLIYITICLHPSGVMGVSVITLVNLTDFVVRSVLTVATGSLSAGSRAGHNPSSPSLWVFSVFWVGGWVGLSVWGGGCTLRTSWDNQTLQTHLYISCVVLESAAPPGVHCFNRGMVLEIRALAVPLATGVSEQGSTCARAGLGMDTAADSSARRHESTGSQSCVLARASHALCQHTSTLASPLLLGCKFPLPQ